MQIRYRLLPGVFPKNAKAVQKLTPAQYTAFIAKTIERGRSNIAVRTPRGWSGALAQGYATEMRRAGTSSPVGIVSNPILYHDVVEKGRNPGKMPPVAALIPWVGSKLGVPIDERPAVAFLVARKIGAQGTDPASMVKDGWDETRQQIKPELKELGLRIVAKLS